MNVARLSLEFRHFRVSVRKKNKYNCRRRFLSRQEPCKMTPCEERGLDDLLLRTAEPRHLIKDSRELCR